MARELPLLLLLVAALMLPACRTMYYDTMEAFGQHKRDIMVTRVEDARDEQLEAKETFKTALERFTEVVGADDASELRDKYGQLDRELDRCERRARAVRDRIESIEQVAGDLFKEWERELDEYASEDLRRWSADQLTDAQERYDDLIGAMHRAEGRMEPVLVAFRDHVLFLKHNLNAQAVASLQGEVVSLETNIAELVADMEAAIAEADAFIEQMS
ncbi:MAG: DUF2959 domain-containing protein [Planctomycetota bacterium]|jgi:hypothetical protein